MSKMSRIENQQGNSILSMLIMSALLTIVLMTLYFSKSNLDRSVNQQDVSIAYKNILDSIKFTINNPYLCSNIIFSDTTITPKEESSYLDKKDYQVDVVAKKAFPATGQDLAAGTNAGLLHINRVYFRNFRYRRDVMLDPINGPPPTKKSKYEVELIVEATYKKGNAYYTFSNNLSHFTKEEDQELLTFIKKLETLDPTQVDITPVESAIKTISEKILDIQSKKTYQPIHMYVQIDNPKKEEAGEIFSCFGKITQAALCENSGGAFDPKEKNTALACNPDLICFTKPLQPSPVCPELYEAISLGKNPETHVPQYLCQRCNKYRKDL